MDSATKAKDTLYRLKSVTPLATTTAGSVWFNVYDPIQPLNTNFFLILLAVHFTYLPKKSVTWKQVELIP